MARTGAALGFTGAMIFFTAELILVVPYAVIHLRTYLLLFLLYAGAGSFGGAVSGALLSAAMSLFRRTNRSQFGLAKFPAGFLFGFYYFFGFYYLNPDSYHFLFSVSANSHGGSTDLLLLLSRVSLNIFWLIVAVFLYKLALRLSDEKGKPFVEFLWIGFLPLSALMALNIRFFIWQPPAVSDAELWIMLFAFALAGLGSMGVLMLLNRVLTNPRSAPLRLGAVVVAGLVFSGGLTISGSPSTASFRLKHASAENGANASRQANIIWIVMDTARRDHISVYPTARITTPNLNAFAKDALVFRQAYSAAPWTLPSHASMFTGTFSSRHGAHHSSEPEEQRGSPLAAENLTIAEVLSANGYRTAAVAANKAYLHRWTGLSQGFDFYFDAWPLVHNLFWGPVLRNFHPDFRHSVLRINEVCLAPEINQIVFDWLDRHASNRERPFFLFINYMEPHGGVGHLPQPFDSRFGFVRNPKLGRRMISDAEIGRVVRFEKEVSPEHKALWNSYIDRKIYFMDHHIGKLLDRLKSSGLYDDSFIIVTSDHGELFGEHHSFSHGVDLYNELIWIPLIVKYPGSRQKGFSDRLVQTVDLMPELLYNLGIEIPAQVQGEPFAEISHPIVSEVFSNKHNSLVRLYPRRFDRDLRAIYSAGKANFFKYIFASNAMSEMYDLKTDPFELDNLIDKRPAVAERLTKELKDWRNSFEPIMSAESKARQIDDKEFEKRLRSLGYIK